MLDKEILEDVENYIFKEKKEFLKTGFIDLDYVLKGVPKGSLITLGARPAMGKNAFLTALMVNFLRQKKKCLFFNFVINKRNSILRMISQISEVDIHNLINNPSENLKNSEKIYNAISEISNFDINIYDETCDINSIKNKIETIKPEFVFIDCLQCIKTNSKKTRTDQISDILSELKQIALDNNCIIFISSQLSRKVEERCCKIPMLSDLRDCGDIENISDVVMFLYREEYYERENPEYKNKAHIIVAKNKYGMCGNIDILFFGRFLKFKEKFIANVEI